MKRKIFSRLPSLLPTHLSRKFFILTIGTLASPARHSTRKVFPVPTGPQRRYPFGSAAERVSPLRTRGYRENLPRRVSGGRGQRADRQNEEFPRQMGRQQRGQPREDLPL